MELTSEKSCCSAGNNQVDEQAGITQHKPDKSTGVGCHFLLQEIFLTQGLNPCLPHCGQILYH